MCVELNSCCCFLELRTGTLIIGFLELFCGVLALIGGGSSLFVGEAKLQAGFDTAFLVLGIVAAVFLILGVRKVSFSK